MASNHHRTPEAPEPALHPPGSRCSHCSGSGREPLPLELEFSQTGARRGELRELAERANLHPGVLSRAFRGKTVPALPTIVQIAAALDVSESRVIRHPRVWEKVMEELAG